jgi:hypothetical protein
VGINRGSATVLLMGIDWVMWLRSHWFGNDEIRSTKLETNSKSERLMTKTKGSFLGGTPRFWTLEFWSFDIVSDFEFRIWGLLIFGIE